MARQAGVRRKNGYWYSEAGGVGRYFGRCDEVTQTQATARLWTALAGGDDKGVDRVVGGGANGDAGVGVCVTPSPSPKASGRKEGTKSRGRWRTLARDSSFLPSHAGDDADATIPPSPPTPTLSTTSPTVGELTTLFLAWVNTHRAAKNHKERSGHLKRFSKGRTTKPAASLNADDLEAFQASLRRYSPTYRRHHEVSVRAMIRWGVKHGHLPAGFDPFTRVEPTRPPAKALLEGDLPTADEVAVIIANATPTLADFLAVQYATGARSGELRSARVGDYQPRTRQIVLRHHKREKTMREPKPRVIVLNADADAIVSRLCVGRPADAPLFRSPLGKAWSENTLSHHFIRARDGAKARPTLTPYALRHLWISEALMAGVDVMVVARMAGTSVAMIERVYGRFRASSLADAQARLDAARTEGRN